MLKFKNMLSKLLSVVYSLLGAGIIGTVIMVGVYSLPTYSIKNNVARSLYIYNLENNYYSDVPSFTRSMLDNFTDSIILNTAAYERGENFGEIIKRAMLCPRYQNDELRMVENLLVYAYPDIKKNFDTIYYARYWHGYMVFIKPLSMFFSLADIRTVNMVVQLLLLVYLMLLLYKTGEKKLTLPYLSAILIFNPISSAMCLQYTSMYIITLVSNIVFLKYKLYKSEKWWLFFLWVGIVTSFFDLLSYPLTALGCNLILFILLTGDKLFAKMQKVVIASALWAIGYAGMWLQKWVIGSVLTENNVIAEAINQVKYRSDFGGDIGIADTFMSNIKSYDTNVFWAFLSISIVLLLIAVLSRKYKFRPDFSIILPLLFVSVYPFVWFVVVRNHSAIHYWMVHKIIMIFILAIVYAVVYSLGKNTKTKITAKKR